MKKLLNTLYVTSENSYLGLDGENIVVYEEQKELGRLPLHNLEGIVSFGYRGTSPALMGACADRNISLCYLTPQGKFLARVTGKVRGNVILRKQQYDTGKDEEKSLTIAKTCILGKVYLWILLPVTTFIVSFIIGKNDFWAKGIWALTLFFGVMYMLAEYGTFAMANNIAFDKLNTPEWGLVVAGV